MMTTPGLGVLVLERIDGGAAPIGHTPPPRRQIAWAGDDVVFDGIADRHLIDIFAAIIPFERG
ncbi:MAG: hypothetical protein ACJ8FP_00700 [Xanthobacteraceae bacterium]